MSADHLACVGKPMNWPPLPKWCLWVLEFVAGFAAVAVILYLLLLLPGCAQIGNMPAPGIHPGDVPITQREFVRADVEAALAIATAGGDKRGEACFTEILRALPTSSSSPTQPTGLISIYAAGRVARLGLQAGLPESVVSACAPMVLNSQLALLKAISFANGMP